MKLSPPSHEPYQATFLPANPMKKIGLLGGMSWESTVPYYRQINETVKARLGGLHRDFDAGRRAGRERSAVRHDGDSCRRRGRAGVGGCRIGERLSSNG